MPIRRYTHGRTRKPRLSKFRNKIIDRKDANKLRRIASSTFRGMGLSNKKIRSLKVVVRSSKRNKDLSGGAYYNKSKNEIVLKKGSKVLDAASGLAHEVGHVAFKGGLSKSKFVRESIANNFEKRFLKKFAKEKAIDVKFKTKGIARLPLFPIFLRKKFKTKR